MGGAAGAGGDPGPMTGGACATDADCPSGGSGTPVCLTVVPGGMCSVRGCEDHGHDCPGDAGNGGTVGSKCVTAAENLCLPLCSSDADCRAGTSCVALTDPAGHGSAQVCFTP